MGMHAFGRFGLLNSARSAADPDAVLVQLRKPIAVPAVLGLPNLQEGARLQQVLLQERRTARQESRRERLERPAATVEDEEIRARLDLAMRTDSPLHERLTLHWTNHFTANGLAYLQGDLERSAIRPHMLGRFEDMLRNVITHPVMLHYLNNVVSFGPNSVMGRRLGRGLNENLGRELLELHTLGADGGYTQEDVLETARILTGWTMILRRDAGPITFAAARHEPGSRVVLGKRYPEGGPEQLHALLRDLSRHPSTARNVARRLVRHFLGDTASPAVTEAVSRAYLESDGHLGVTTEALVRHPESWSLPPRKLRPPTELLFAVARLLGGLPDTRRLRATLRILGQPWRLAPSPAGWPEGDHDWGAPDAITTRLDWALRLGGQLPAGLDARRIAEERFGDALSPETRQAVRRAANGAQALALLIMSPEVQRR